VKEMNLIKKKKGEEDIPEHREEEKRLRRGKK
jgi:hypothetical protein